MALSVPVRDSARCSLAVAFAGNYAVADSVVHSETKRP